MEELHVEILVSVWWLRSLEHFSINTSSWVWCDTPAKNRPRGPVFTRQLFLPHQQDMSLWFGFLGSSVSLS